MIDGNFRERDEICVFWARIRLLRQKLPQGVPQYCLTRPAIRSCEYLILTIRANEYSANSVNISGAICEGPSESIAVFGTMSCDK